MPILNGLPTRLQAALKNIFPKKEEKPVQMLLRFDQGYPGSFERIKGALEKIGFNNEQNGASPTESAQKLALDLLASGNEYAEAGQHTEAIEAFESALEQNPHLAVAWYNIGNSHFALSKESALNGSQNGAQIEAYRQAAEIDPAHSNAWFNLGNALCESMRFEEGLAAYEKVIELNTKDIDAWHAVWFALRKLGRDEEAAMAHDKIIELDPGYPLDIVTLETG